MFLAFITDTVFTDLFISIRQGASLFQ